MEFTTPASYGDTVVTVGGIVNQSEIITASASCTATHLETATDSDNEWPEPTAVKYTWAGKTKDGQNVDAVLDIMAEVPGFIKSIIGSVAGTKPYVYQVSYSVISSGMIVIPFANSCLASILLRTS
jgi:hypothetical protein